MELLTISIIVVVSIVTFPTDCFPYRSVPVPLVGDTINRLPPAIQKDGQGFLL